MSAWRRKALALFPELQEQLQGDERTLHDLFYELEDRAEAAHKAKDLEHLRKIHGFAEWCLHQGGELWREAAIGFYENLFFRVDWESLIPWLSPFAVDQIKQTWAIMDREEKFDELVRTRKEYDYRTHVYSTGDIERI